MSRMAKPVMFPGDAINYLHPASAEADIAVGDVVALVSICGIAETNIKKGERGALRLDGVWDITAVTGTAFAVGDAVYWDSAAKNATKVASTSSPSQTNTFLGIVIMPKASAANVACVKIGYAKV